MVTKDAKPGQLVYGELTTSPPVLDKLYQFYNISPLTNNACKLTLESFIEAKSPIKKLFIYLVLKRVFKKNLIKAMNKLHEFIKLEKSL